MTHMAKGAGDTAVGMAEKNDSLVLNLKSLNWKALKY